MKKVFALIRIHEDGTQSVWDYSPFRSSLEANPGDCIREAYITEDGCYLFWEEGNLYGFVATDSFADDTVGYVDSMYELEEALEIEEVC